MADSSAKHLARLEVYFEISPAISLLRSTNAPYVVDFLHQQFKRGRRITIGFPDLAAAFADYQERLYVPELRALRACQVENLRLEQERLPQEAVAKSIFNWQRAGNETISLTHSQMSCERTTGAAD